MAYVDGFLLPVRKNKLAKYRKVARAAGKIWMEFGALDYRECVGDDVSHKMAESFRRGVRLKSDEVICFSWIVYTSKAQRNQINKKIMKDPRILTMMDPKDPIMDDKRMGFGGFKSIVSYARK